MRKQDELCPNEGCSGIVKEQIMWGNPYDKRNLLYICNKCNLMVRNGSQGYCDRCQQLQMHRSKPIEKIDDPTKQCQLCGRDWPANRCSVCYKLTKSLGCKCKVDSVQAIQQISLPYEFRDEQGHTCVIMGWHAPMKLHVALADGNECIYSSKNSIKMLHLCGLSPENIPGWDEKKRPSLIKAAKEMLREKHVEYMTPQEWRMWERFKEQSEELLECADDALYDWRQHVEYLEQEHLAHDLEDLEERVRRLPRLIRFITTGITIPMDVNDEDLSDYDDPRRNELREAWDYAPKRPRTKVKVIIEDISTGEL